MFKAATLLIISYLISINLHLLIENKQKYRWIAYAGYACVMLGLYTQTPFSGISFILLVIALCLLTSILPSITKKLNDVACVNFCISLLISKAFALLIALVLGGGVALLFASADYLFNVHFPKECYLNILPIAFTLVGPFYFLTGIPNSMKAHYSYTKSLSFVLNYLLVPFIILFLCILYAYIIKIALQWSLPKGNIAYMITSLVALGSIAHFFAILLLDSKHKVLLCFERYFYPLMIVPLLLLFIAIETRITQYGITQSRYLLALVAIWLTCILLYRLFSKTKNFSYHLLCLGVLCLCASLGPWSADNLSTNSQLHRLQILLEKIKF